jgi:hypothetical protein
VLTEIERPAAAVTTAAEQFATRFERGLARAPELAERLAFAETTVCLTVRDSDAAVTLLLDRAPPEVHPEAEPAQINLEIDADDLEQLADGTLLLPLAMLDGRVDHRGPVRRLLGVTAVLRAVLEAGGSDEDRGGA